MSSIQNTGNTQPGKDMEQNELSYIACGYTKLYSHFERLPGIFL